MKQQDALHLRQTRRRALATERVQGMCHLLLPLPEDCSRASASILLEPAADSEDDLNLEGAFISSASLLMTQTNAQLETAL